MDIMTDLRIVSTVLSFLVFMGIFVWAFNRRSKAGFDKAANIPFLDEDLPTNNKSLDRGEQQP